MIAANEDVVDLYGRLRDSWSPETGRHWRADNPAAGQCGVSALIVNDILGGAILKTNVNGAWHFYNFVSGRRIDFTMSQFCIPIFYNDLPSNRDEALLDCSPEQYALLRSRVTARAPYV